MKRITTAVASLLLMAGCATSTLNINPETNSEALQVARAAKLVNIKDQKIAKADFDRLADSSLYQAAWTSTMYYNPAPGFSSGFGLALGVASILLPNKPKESFSHLIAWMPEEMAENPQKALIKMDEIILNAVTNMAEELDLKPYKTNTISAYGRQFTYLTIDNEEQDCKLLEDGYRCLIYSRLYPPKLVDAPTLLGNQGGKPAYLFPLSKYHSVGFDPRKENITQLDQIEMLTVYSKYLPEWAYLYIAPQTVSDATGDTINFPFILHQGKTMLFLKPETD